MWKATKARRALFGFLLIIAFVLGYQEEFMSQAKADGGIKERAARTRGVRRRFRMAVRGELVMGQIWPASDEYAYL